VWREWGARHGRTDWEKAARQRTTVYNKGRSASFSRRDKCPSMADEQNQKA
jgi:hypothetical protein